MKKLLCLMLSAVMLLLLLASCNGGKADPPQESGEKESDTMTDTPPVPDNPDHPTDDSCITVADLEKYSIVYSESASTDVIKAAKNLSNAIRVQFGYMIAVKDDYFNDFSPTYQKGEYEILIGQTNREESSAVTESLLFKDSCYELVGKKIVIAAHDDVTVLKAISDFNLKFVLSAKKDAEIFYSQSDNRVFEATYPHQTVTLGGTGIGNYRIVYPENGQAFEAMLAQKLWLAIADECGAMLPVVSDSTPYQGEYEILIGKTNRSADVSAVSGLGDGEGYLHSDGKLTLLCGQNALGNATAVTGLIDAMQAAEGTAAALNPQTQVQPLLESDGRISSMTFNLQSWNRTEERMVRLRDTILRYLPDTIGLQEGTPEWDSWLIEQLGDYYGFIGTDSPMHMCPILYAKDKFTVEKSEVLWLTGTPYEESALPGQEWPRIYTYAILVRNADNTRFMHLNTHLDTANVRVEETNLLAAFLLNYADVPTVMTGDFNSAIDSEEMKVLLQDDLVNSMSVADVVITNTYGLIDFILVHDYYMDVKYYELAYEPIYGGYASDHRAVYAEYIIDMNGTDVAEDEKPADGNLPVRSDREGVAFNPPHFLF